MAQWPRPGKSRGRGRFCAGLGADEAPVVGPGPVSRHCLTPAPSNTGQVSMACWVPFLCPRGSPGEASRVERDKQEGQLFSTIRGPAGQGPGDQALSSAEQPRQPECTGQPGGTGRLPIASPPQGGPALGLLPGRCPQKSGTTQSHAQLPIPAIGCFAGTILFLCSPGNLGYGHHQREHIGGTSQRPGAHPCEQWAISPLAPARWRSGPSWVGTGARRAPSFRR